MTDEKYTRRFPRRKFDHGVGMIHLAQYDLVQAIEIGEGGILIQSDKEVVAGQLVVISFFVPQRDFICVQGEVLYEKKNDGQVRHIGIKFLNMDFKCKRMIRDYIALKSADEALTGSLFNL